MSLAEALFLLAGDWPGIREELPDDTLGAIVRAAEGEPAEAPAAIVRALSGGLPATHPVRRALARSRRYAVSRGSAPHSALTALAGDARAELVSREADRRLLALPMAPPQDVPSDADLIRLPVHGGPDRVPAFQFDADGRPHPVVLEINRMLDADGDPFGVADWWLGGNAWLDGPPVSLLGRSEDALLVQAAQAELAVD